MRAGGACIELFKNAVTVEVFFMWRNPGRVAV